MKKKIFDKIKEIEKYISELEKIIPESISKYKKDFKTKAACERYFEKIIEAIVDLAFLIIKRKNYSIPEEDKESFEILSKEEIISTTLCNKLKDAKGMRNIIAHEYGKIDDAIVFNSITEEIISDALELIEKIKKKI